MGEVEIKQAKYMNNLWSDLMARRTNKSAKYWHDLADKPIDVYWTPTQALKAGIIDVIIPERE